MRVQCHGCCRIGGRRKRLRPSVVLMYLMMLYGLFRTTTWFVRDWLKTWKWGYLIVGAVCVVFLCVYFGMKPLTNKNYNWWMRGLVYILFVSREFLIGLCPFCLVMEVVMIIAHCVPISVLLDHGWIAGSICCLGGLGIVGYGLINGTHVHIRRRRIGTYLSSSLRVIHVSDLHSGVRGSGALKRIVSKVNGLRGDMIVMTGDVLDSIALLVRPSEEDRIGGSSRMVENKHYGCRSDETRPLGELFAPLGVFFVTGNHEFYHDIDGVMRTLARYPNIRILDGRVLDLVHNGDPIRLIGLAGNRRSFPATFEIPPFNHPRLVDTDAPLALTTPFTMLLQHQPYKRASVQNMLRSSATVGFFGHTHGGQTFPNWPAVKFGWAASRGRVELKGHREGEGGGSEFVSEEEEWKGKRSRSWLVDGNPSMFVHQGTGTMQAPFRTIGNCSIDVYDFVGQDHDC